jgi:hypothetical protein
MREMADPWHSEQENRGSDHSYVGEGNKIWILEFGNWNCGITVQML